MLFVDDNPNVRGGLERMLWSMRKEWDIAFAGSGAEALEAMARKPCDVIVTDMRMPAMNGADLLEKVRDRYPTTLRIVLTGQSDEEALLKSVVPAHRFLSKPCDAKMLKDAVSRAGHLRDLLHSNEIRAVVSRIGSLPSLPTLYARLIEEVKSPDCSIDRVAEIIRQDVAMTAKVLQLVNSAFFGLPRHVSSIRHATNIIGVNTIKDLALLVKAFSEFEGSEDIKALIDRTLNHSLDVACLARRIMEIEEGDKEIADATFMVALLHDVGKLVLATGFDPTYGSVAREAAAQGVACWKAEQGAFGASHAEVGAHLLTLWGLPDATVEGVAFHHDPAAAIPEGFGPLIAVHAANALVHAKAAQGNGETIPALDSDCLERFGLTNRLTAWREAIDDISSGGTSDDAQSSDRR
jgi:putative nucleotidyltransferase with HDIG domain